MCTAVNSGVLFMMSENYMFLNVFTCAERAVQKMRKMVLWARLQSC